MGMEIVTMFGLAVISVGMWTLRVTVAASGRRSASSMVAALEAVVFVLTFSHLVSDLTSPIRLASYAAGVAAGTAVGLYVHDRTARREVEIQIVAPGPSNPVLEVVRDLGWPATVSSADGPHGPVTQLWLTVQSSESRAVMEIVRCAAPDAFVSSRALASTINAQRPASSPTLARGQRETAFCTSHPRSHPPHTARA